MGRASLPRVRQKSPKKRALFVTTAHERRGSSLPTARQLYGELTPQTGQPPGSARGRRRNLGDEGVRVLSGDDFPTVPWPGRCHTASSVQRGRVIRDKPARRARKRCRRITASQSAGAPSPTTPQVYTPGRRNVEVVPMYAGENAAAVSPVTNRNRRRKRFGGADGAASAEEFAGSSPKSLPREARSRGSDRPHSRMVPVPISYSDAQAVFQESDSDSNGFDDNVTTSSFVTEGDRSSNGKARVCRTCGCSKRRGARMPCLCDQGPSWFSKDFWSLDPRERQRQLRYVVLAEKAGASRALEDFAAKNGGQAIPAQDLLKRVSLTDARCVALIRCRARGCSLPDA